MSAPNRASCDVQSVFLDGNRLLSAMHKHRLLLRYQLLMVYRNQDLIGVLLSVTNPSRIRLPPFE